MSILTNVESHNPKDTSPSAFPAEGGAASGLHPTPGMTLREFYAGLAMAGYCCNPEVLTNDDTGKKKADWAVTDADALIERLKR